MPQKTPEFQPGLILLGVLVGAFHARGTTFERWCKDNGLRTMNMRNAALGGSRTEAAQKALEKAINAAGRDVVRQIYTERMIEHCAQLQRGAA